jgi:hypothetical protein
MIKIISLTLLTIFNLSFCYSQNVDSTSIKRDSIHYKYEGKQKIASINILDTQKNIISKSEIEIKIGQASRHLAYSWLVPLASFVVGALVSKENEPLAYGILGGGAGLGIYYNVSGFTKIGKVRRRIRKENTFQ